MELKDIAHIQPGYHSKGKVVSDPQGDGFLVQLKDLQTPGQVVQETDTKIATNSVSEKYHIRHGDVIVASRGHATFAVTVSDSKAFIASGHCYVIRPESNLVTDYLCWYLNTVKGQQHLQRYKRGTSTPILASEGLRTLDLPLPSPEEQTAIGKLYELYRREYSVSIELAEKRLQAMEHTLLAKLEVGAPAPTITPQQTKQIR